MSDLCACGHGSEAHYGGKGCCLAHRCLCLHWRRPPIRCGMENAPAAISSTSSPAKTLRRWGAVTLDAEPSYHLSADQVKRANGQVRGHVSSVCHRPVSAPGGGQRSFESRSERVDKSLMPRNPTTRDGVLDLRNPQINRQPSAATPSRARPSRATAPTTATGSRRHARQRLHRVGDELEPMAA
jgi:hypothetical protein